MEHWEVERNLLSINLLHFECEQITLQSLGRHAHSSDSSLISDSAGSQNLDVFQSSPSDSQTI